MNHVRIYTKIVTPAVLNAWLETAHFPFSARGGKRVHARIHQVHVWRPRTRRLGMLCAVLKKKKWLRSF